jgi:hypothetical protein
MTPLRPHVFHLFSGDPEAESAKSLREERVWARGVQKHALPSGLRL